MAKKPPHEQLARAMKARNITQADLARACGARTGTVANWVTGNRSVGLRYAFKLQQLLGLDPTIWAVEPRAQRQKAAAA